MFGLWSSGESKEDKGPDTANASACPVDHTNPEIVKHFLGGNNGNNVENVNGTLDSSAPPATNASQPVDSCPVDHTDPEIVKHFLGGNNGSNAENENGTLGSNALPATKTSQPTDLCPVDHTNPEIVEKFLGKDHVNGGEGLPPLPNIPQSLSSDRETSSIPRAGTDGKKWVYPSEQQFYSAMRRKNFNPHARDMPVVIPIHNAVNERCWYEILQWEKNKGGKICGGPQLLKFEGDSSKLTPKARVNMLLGATRPFDRHDWTIDRCGKTVDYVIDFYSGEPDPSHPERQSFYLDVRPKLNSWEGVKMRVEKFFGY